MTQAGSQPAGGPPATDLRVVLVDDHAVVRAGLRAVVDACPGIRVAGEASNGLEAVRLAESLRPDVMVMDLSMPEMDGATATERIHSQWPDIRIIALTAHEDRAHLTRLLQAGATGYVLKRGAADELVNAIRAVAAGETYVAPTLAGNLLRRTATLGATEMGQAPDLSEREEEVLRQIAWGHSNKEIGRHLGISTKTVETYKARIADKVGLKSRPDMVRYALQRGWLKDP
jgi:DNA-binding NarL/FixJ family response regulator